MGAYINGQPVNVSRMDSGDFLVAFDPWTNWGHGVTLEEALDDLVDSTREMRLGPWAE